MPCRDYYPDDYSIRQENRYQEQRDKLARIACRAMALLEAKGLLGDLHSKESMQWYQEHKAADARRIARDKAAAIEKERMDKAKESALKKLNPLERIALGVKP